MSFTFNGINCESLGMYVEKYPDRPFTARKSTSYRVPGRTGDLVVDEDALENVVQEYEVYMKKKLATNMQEQLTAIAKWLLQPAGYSVLTDTYDATIKRYARYMGGVEFLNSLNKYGKAKISFDCKAQRYPVTDVIYAGTMDDITPITITLPASGLLPAYPLLEILGSGANTSFQITSGTLNIIVPARSVAISKIVIDWETHSVYNAYNGIIPWATTVSGDWVKLGDGDSVTLRLDTTPAPTYKFYPRQFSV